MTSENRKRLARRANLSRLLSGYARRREPVAGEKVAGMEETTMRKVFSLLDDEQRQALLEVVDLGTALVSAGLIASILKVFIELVT